MSSASNPTPQFPEHVPLVVIISGPAGAGKTSLVNSLLASSNGFVRAITCTCRPPRRGEVDGVDYHFLMPEEFQRRLEAGEFLEHAKVYGYDYGMPIENIRDALQQGKDLVINIDVQGAATIRKRAQELTFQSLGGGFARNMKLAEILVAVFIMPPLITVLENRLKKRGTDDEATIQRRLAVVRQEMQRWTEYDYVLVSGTLAEDLRRLQAVLTTEQLRARRLSIWGHLRKLMRKLRNVEAKGIDERRSPKGST